MAGMDDGRQIQASAAFAALSAFDNIAIAIVILLILLILIIWRRRNRRKNRGNSVYLFH